MPKHCRPGRHGGIHLAHRYSINFRIVLSIGTRFFFRYICNEGGLAPDQVEQVCAAYFGQASRSLPARIWLFRCMPNVVSTLWGAIQHQLSEIEYDCWDPALERRHRAQDLVESPEFDIWLHDAALSAW